MTGRTDPLVLDAFGNKFKELYTIVEIDETDETGKTSKTTYAYTGKTPPPSYWFDSNNKKLNAWHIQNKELGEQFYHKLKFVKTVDNRPHPGQEVTIDDYNNYINTTESAGYISFDYYKKTFDHYNKYEFDPQLKFLGGRRKLKSKRVRRRIRKTRKH
jgi:hypothetical protein